MTSSHRSRPRRRPFHKALVRCGALLCAAILAGTSTGQPPASAGPEGKLTENGAANAEARAEISARLERVRRLIESVRAKGDGTTVPVDLSTEFEFLRWLDLLYSQQETVKSSRDALKAELEEVSDRLETLRVDGLSEEPPYSFLVLDDTHEQLLAEQAHLRTYELEIKTRQSSLRVTRDAFEAAEKNRRAQREAVQTQAPSATPGDAVRRQDLAELRSLALSESIKHERAELETLELKKQISQAQCSLLQESIQLLRKSVQFSQQDLEAKLATIDKLETRLREDLQGIQARIRTIDQQLLSVTRRRETADHDPTLEAEEQTLLLFQETNKEELSLLSQLLRDLGIVRVTWRRRFEAANQRVSPDDLALWHERTKDALDDMARLAELIELRLGECRDDQASLQKRLISNASDSDPAKVWTERQADEVARLSGVYGSSLAMVKSAQRMLQRTHSELGGRLSQADAEHWFSTFRRRARATWDYELTSVDDRPITVSKVVIGLSLLLVGFLFSRYLSRWLGRRALPRIGLDEGAAAAFQTIAFYLIFMCFGFFALECINLPLTVFAFMGGAVAIGVGFGSQNILNNFISGLILLAERPIRVGDLVDVDGLYATVERIGARSTRVRTGSNLEIIVPNSKFLENNVTNWTLSDTRIRVSVSVGVAYGSPTRRVEELLRQAVLDNPQVLQDIDPIVIFGEFGDNSLNFEVHFWIHMRTMMQGNKVESEIRHTIDELFRREEITIAYPQRDVHLDSLKPIEVSIQSPPQGLTLGTTRNAA